MLDKGTVLLGTLCLGARQYNIPSALFWEQVVAEAGYAVFLLILVIGVFGVFSPWESLTENSRLNGRVGMQRQILSTFGQLLDMGRRIKPAINITDPSLHIWRRKRTLRHPLSGELLRVATYRLGATPATRSFHPTRGIGVIGLCWKYDKEIGVDVAELSQNLTDSSRFADYQSHHGVDAVMGLSWDEFCRINHRGAVFATPVRDGRSKFVGCVSFDVAHGYTQLNGHHLWHELNRLSNIIGHEGFQDV
ncbi:hypothetical protein [Sphaerisporangium album]|uniref:hypothetical protein n=1 Tax=Sphaerisporangium album TaxID=509200 RepID=UPI0011C04E2E|nr:hypothetical protein [Sphaerisporangium album]